MMEKERLRRADCITGFLLIALGLFLLGVTLGMPMKDSYGGVMNVWYVSPALLPLFLNAMITLLGTVLLVQSIKDGGFKYLRQSLSRRVKVASAGNIRFAAILIALLSYVYLDLPRIDFFLTNALFLIMFISAFYFDDAALLNKLTLFYFLGNLVLLLLFLTGLDRLINGLFIYGMDVLALIFFLTYLFYTSRLVRSRGELRRKLRTTLMVSLIVPLIVCPTFRYFLLVPLPKEGGIIRLMNLIRYSLR